MLWMVSHESRIRVPGVFMAPYFLMPEGAHPLWTSDVRLKKLSSCGDP